MVLVVSDFSEKRKCTKIEEIAIPEINLQLCLVAKSRRRRDERWKRGGGDKGFRNLFQVSPEI